MTNTHTQTQPTNNYKILIIEDDFSTASLVATMLNRGGYESVIAHSGAQGIELARQELPDLIICDVMMPEMNGLDVLRTLQDQSDTTSIPFIFLTARVKNEDVRAGMELGADDYLTKPVHGNVLLNAINSRLRRHQQLQAERLALFTQRLVLSQEHQRQRTAHALDNEVNQSLRSLQFILNLLAPPAHQDASLYNDAKEMLAGLIQQVEGFVQEMHPTMLKRLGLVPTIRWLTEQYNLTIELEMENLDYAFDSQVEVCVFRLIQEALNNITLHGQTNKATVSLKYVAPVIEVRVEDKGVGFDLEQVLQSSESIGLQYMYGLMAWLNGELHITSRSNEGTAVYALIPPNTATPTRYSSASPDYLRLVANRASKAEQAGGSPGVIKILLAMEQPLQRRGMRRLLMNSAQFQVIGEVQELTGTVAAIEKSNPHLLVINPIAQDQSQTEILQAVTKTFPQTPILVISSAVHDEYVRAALESGALGYIPNTATITDMHTAIMRVAKKQPYLSPTLTFDLAHWQATQTS